MYALAGVLKAALAHGGVFTVLILTLLGLFIAVIVWIGKRYAKYLDTKADSEETLRNEILQMHKTQATQANAYTNRMVDAFVMQVDSDKKFQAKTIEAMHALSAGLSRIESQHGVIQNVTSEVNLKVSEIKSWLGGQSRSV